VAGALMSKVEEWAKEKHLEAIHGPMGFTNLDHEGMLVDGFDELGTMVTIYNYSYYPMFIEKLGYKKDCDSIEYEIKVPEKIDPRISKAAEVVLRRNKLSLPRFTNKHKMRKFAPEIFGLINAEYAHLYGVTLLSKEQIEHYTNTYFGFLHPDFVPLILDEKDKVVAFGVVIPSLSRALQKGQGRLIPFGWYHLLRALRKNERADLYLIAVKKEYQGLGLGIVLMDRVAKVFQNRGIRLAESNPELESNENIQSQWKFFDKRQHKRRRCYIKYL
jgi:GNAT superfamily N-acetyltransferase